MSLHDILLWSNWILGGVVLPLTIYAFYRTIKTREVERDARAKRIEESLRGAPLSKQNLDAYAYLYSEDRDERMIEWMGMLERRVAELDPMYQAYPWGRTICLTVTTHSSSPITVG